MPIDNSTWEQASERESTATRILEFLDANRSEAYTTTELVAEIVPEDTGDEGVIAYYRAVLELLAHNGRIDKRNVPDDSGGADRIPHFRASAEDESREALATEPTAPATRELSLDHPIRIRMAEDSGPIPVRIEEGSQPAAETDTPFFVRWYRWYRRRL